MQRTENITKEGSRKLVNFRIDRKDYALDIDKIIEIISYKEITPIPRLPLFVEGVVELRGVVIPVIDLKKKLQLTQVSDKSPSHILIVNIRRTKVGIIVDEVKEVIGVEERSIHLPHDFIKDKEFEYLKGICKFKDRLILILDVEGLFTHDERNALSEIRT